MATQKQLSLQLKNQTANKDDRHDVDCGEGLNYKTYITHRIKMNVLLFFYLVVMTLSDFIVSIVTVQ